MNKRIDDRLTTQDLGILALVFGFTSVDDFEMFLNRQERKAEIKKRDDKLANLSRKKTRAHNGIPYHGLPPEARLQASKIKGKTRYV